MIIVSNAISLAPLSRPDSAWCGIHWNRPLTHLLFNYSLLVFFLIPSLLLIYVYSHIGVSTYRTAVLYNAEPLDIDCYNMASAAAELDSAAHHISNSSAAARSARAQTHRISAHSSSTMSSSSGVSNKRANKGLRRRSSSTMQRKGSLLGDDPVASARVILRMLGRWAKSAAFAT